MNSIRVFGGVGAVFVVVWLVGSGVFKLADVGRVSSALSSATTEAADAHLDQGIKALNAKDYAAALGWFDKAIQMDPHNAAAYISRGLVHTHQKAFELALADFNKAVELEPQDASAYVHRGYCQSERNELDKAIEDFTTAIRLEPEELDAFIYRAYAYLDSKKLDEAFADANRAVLLQSDSAEAYTARADVQSDRKHYSKAIADYQEACRLDPKAPDPRSGLAWLWATCPNAKFRNGKAAVDLARRACELSEWKEAFYFDTLAAAYAEVGNFDEAIKWQQKAVDAPDAFRESERPKVSKRLQLYQNRQPYRDDS